MPSTLIRNGTLINPTAAQPERAADILIRDGVIAEIGPSLAAEADEIIDAAGRTVTAGLVDMHVHLREPGREDKETIRTGTLAAAKGGITTILGMPNTEPRLDNQSAVKFVLERGRQQGVVHVYTTGNITKRGEGKELAEMWELKNEGVKMLTDDGRDIQNAGLYRAALEYAATHDMALNSHCENLSLIEGSGVHEGWVSTQLGLAANPVTTETAQLAQIIELLRETPVPYHVTHTSSRQGAELIRRAKRDGIPITMEASPHHLVLTDEALLGYNTFAKVSAPIRSEEHRQALIAALQDGTVDVIATDHAPHTDVEKMVEFQHAAVGMVGLETFFPVLYTKLVKEWGVISLPRLIELITINPARIMREDRGRLEVGAPADITVWDLDTPWTIDRFQFVSKSKNTAFHGWEVYGRALEVLVEGKRIVKNGELTER